MNGNRSLLEWRCLQARGDVNPLRREQTQLDMDKIARGLGAERRGKVSSSGGHFGAMQILAEIEARFRVPSGGGRPTHPAWRSG